MLFRSQNPHISHLRQLFILKPTALFISQQPLFSPACESSKLEFPDFLIQLVHNIHIVIRLFPDAANIIRQVD